MAEDAPRAEQGPSAPTRVLLAAGGTLALALGAFGAVVPLLPTTPFVLLAAGCYVRAWPAAHRWLRGHRFFGPIARSGREGRYLPPRAKAMALLMTATSFGVTLVWAVHTPALRIAVGLMAVLVCAWLLRMPTRPPDGPGLPSSDAPPTHEDV